MFLLLLTLGAASIEAQTLKSNEQFAASRNSAAENELQAGESRKIWNGESIRRSIALYSEAAEQWTQISEWQKAASCLRQTARLYLLLGDHKTAYAQLTKALKIDGKNNHTGGKAATLSLLSRVSLHSGNIPDSKKYMTEALALSRQSDDLTAQAMALHSAGEFHYNQSDSDKPVAFYEQSLDLWRKAGDRRGEMLTLLSLAYAYAANGNPVEGLNKSLEAQQKAVELNDKRGQAIARIMIGHMNLVMDEKQAALNVYQAAGEIFPGDMDFIENARLQNAIGSIYEDYGQFQLSLNYRQKAFELFQKEQYLYGQLATLPSLGKLSYLSGDETSALKYFDEAVKLARKLGDEFYLAYVWRELGDFYKKKNFDNEAVVYYKKSLPILQKLNSKRIVANVQNSLGIIYERQRNTDLARQYYDSALRLSREIKNKFTEVETLYNLSRVSSIENNREKALEYAKNSVELSDNLYLDINNSKLRSSYLSNVFDHHELYIHLLMQRHKQSPDENFALQALQAAEKSRARVMLENLSFSEAKFTKDADPETVRREKEVRVLLNTKADKLTDLLSQNADRSETDKISSEINELESEFEDIRARLKQQSPVYSAIKNPAPFDAADFQQTVLDENTLLLEFSLGKQESYLWLVGKEEISSYVLPPREEIEANVEILRGLLEERKLKDGESVEDFQQRIARAEARYESVSKELSRQLFGQIAGKISSRRLVIVADGELHYFPLAALPLPEGSEPILLTNETVYAPSAQTLAALVKSRRQSSAAPKNLLVFSDPIFTNDDARFSQVTKPSEKTETAQTERFRFVESLANLPRLSASKDESEAIISIVGEGSTDNYSGFAATRGNLLNLRTDDYKILHFATHGMTNEARPELSGIVLSRYDENGQKLDEFFRIHDIYALNLNADLVVLSACETGIGKEVRGEGLMSLNNAFLQTGAKSVMASLWKVEDGATLELMKHFYEAMANEKLTPSQSLRKAQIRLRENPQYRSPFFWAAFTVQGDFRSVPEISRGFGLWVYLVPLAAIGLIGFYLFKRKK